MAEEEKKVYLRRNYKAAAPAEEPRPDETIATEDQPLVALMDGYDDRGYRRGGINLDTFSFSVAALLMLLLLIYAFFATYKILTTSQGMISVEKCTETCLIERQKTNGQIDLQRASLTNWLRNIDSAYYADRKVAALSLSASQSDNLLLGLFEQFQNNNKIEAAIHYLFAAENGYSSSFDLLQGLDLTIDEVEQLKNTFIEKHALNGGGGFLKLGQLYLDDTFVKPGPQNVTDEFYALYKYYLPAKSIPQAFKSFQMAALCDYGEAYDWLSYMAPDDGLSIAYKNRLRQEAQERLDVYIAEYGGDKQAFCSGAYLKSRLAQIAPASLLDQRSGRIGSRDLIGVMRKDDAAFAQYTLQQAGAAPVDTDVTVIGRADDSSRAFRDNPGSDMVVADPLRDAQDGLPPDCTGSSPAPNCVNRKQFLTCGDESRYWFSRGEAEMAVGNTTRARVFFSESIKIGRKCGADSAVLSSKRLGALNLTCEYTSASLARISRNARQNPEGGDIISLSLRQKSLRALGHYQDDIDGKYGPNTRKAVADFQRELGFRETGDLTPLETVYLVCSAAENARDRDAKNTLGIMYITGLGVVQNTDSGLLWLKDAADSGDIDALYNLAIIYGSGTVLSSYRLCDVVESEERADGYLEEAAQKGHPIAKELVSKYGRLSPSERWRQIRDVELEVEGSFYDRRLTNVGQGCTPNPEVPGPVTAQEGEAQ